MVSGVIDIGSNSIKLLIGEPSGGDIMILESLKNVVPIGRATFLKGSISHELINLTINTLEKYKKILKDYGIKQVFIIATTAVREADNRNIFVDTIRRKTGFEIEVLNVGDIVYYIDAYISHKLKGIYPVGNKNLLIAEMGAGSLDISLLKKGFTLMNTGLALGGLRFKQIMGKIDGSREEMLEALQEYVENEFYYFKSRLPRIHVDDVFIIDENQELLKAVLPSTKVAANFFQFSLEDVDKVIGELATKTPEEIARDYDMALENTEALWPYMVILKMFFKLTGIARVHILETSLAEAVLANKVLGLELSKRHNRSNQLLSVAHSICEQYNVNIDHARHVSHLVKTLFEGLSAQLGLEERDLLYLQLAAYLHDIGKFISNRSHHKHSEYIISSLNLLRLTDEEIRTIACVARYHRRGDPQKAHLLYSSLSEDRQIAVQKMASLLRMANALDHAHRQKIQGIKVINGTSNDITLQVDTQMNFLLEKNDFLEKKELFERITGSRIRLVINESF